MGDFSVKPIRSYEDRSAFYKYLFRDLKAFEIMLNDGLLINASDTVGLEQELCLIDQFCQPATNALEILDNIDDPHYTNELALFNLEINLDPRKLTGNCFSWYEKHLFDLLIKGQKVAQAHGSTIFMTGILPTIGFRHLFGTYMTPEDRYKYLSEGLLELRGNHFEIYLQGIDDFNATLDSVLFEACNTSFQLHLQVAPDEFNTYHNWAQMISGPVLSACTNSPLLFGKDLWAENRIALFKQSLDTRGNKNHTRVKMPRVYFGNAWLSSSALEIWKKEVIRFPVLLMREMEVDPVEELKNGRIPGLNGIRVHNGTTYTWNRLCYGVHENQAHIRIECRYLPAGPTPIDEIANFAFWVGLMKGLPEDKKDFWKKIDFRVAKQNFVNGARTGIATVFNWFGELIPAQRLILDKLLPMARNGLASQGIVQEDIDKYLSIIEQRVTKMQTGSTWQSNNFSSLLRDFQPSSAAKVIVCESSKLQQNNIPVHEWRNIKTDYVRSNYQHITARDLVEDMMNREVISIKENSTVEVAARVMEWMDIHHLPVESPDGKLVGIVNAHIIKANMDHAHDEVKSVMISDVVSIGPGNTKKEALERMVKFDVSCLPVIENNLIVGIITENDFQ